MVLEIIHIHTHTHNEKLAIIGWDLNGASEWVSDRNRLNGKKKKTEKKAPKSNGIDECININNQLLCKIITTQIADMHLYIYNASEKRWRLATPYNKQKTSQQVAIAFKVGLLLTTNGADSNQLNVIIMLILNFACTRYISISFCCVLFLYLPVEDRLTIN